MGVGGVHYRLESAAEFVEAEPASGEQVGEHLPITISGEGRHIVEYYGVDNLGNSEPPHTTTVQIDLTPPTTTPTLTGLRLSNDRYRPPMTVTLSGQDNLSGLAAYEIDLNNNGWLTITGAGDYTLTYRAIDRAGNVGSGETVRFVIAFNRPLYLPFIFKPEM